MPNDTGNKIHHRHRTYTLAFKQEVIRETLEPDTSVSMVARRHDINANIVFAWRSQYRSGKLALPESGVVEAPRPANTELLPVVVVEAADGSAVTHTTPSAQGSSSGAHETVAAMPASTPQCCEVEIEVGKRRVRIRGLPLERAEQFLHDCLR
ncbi:transposase [Burkholderia sp. OK233]|nr:transposase [Burkholderia sp. OK233]SOF01821.1 transposase [Burkholderia sp. OK233]